jgi:GT2 family glycosyltransferase
MPNGNPMSEVTVTNLAARVPQAGLEPPLVAVVIPNWNGCSLLDTCLRTLATQSWRDFAVIVVDNGSTDGTVEWVRKEFRWVRVMANEENQGFGRAVNQGICASGSRYVVTLNNDTKPEPGWLAALVNAELDPTVGMCASRMLFADRPEVIDSAGLCLDRAGIAWDRRGGEADDGREAGPVEVFGPCGGAALYRRAMLDEIGLFDEDFFAYLEDVDLAWRARQAGWRCLYAPAARVLHHHSATSVEGSSFKRYLLGRNKIWLIAKNYPFARLWPYVPLLLLYDLAAVFYSLAARRDTHALRGRLAGLMAAKRMWRKRQRPDPALRNDLDHLTPLETPWRVLRRYCHLAPVDRR